MRVLLPTFCLLASTFASSQFSAKSIVRQFRLLQGSSFLEAVGNSCRQPLNNFGYCLVGKDPSGREVRPASRIGQKFWRKGQRKMAKLRRSDEIRILENTIGAKVDQCFEASACPLRPMEAVRCFLDFVINGGPYDRVAQCIADSWQTPGLDISVPEFADLAGLEADVKLFAGIGLYKRWRRDRDGFWAKVGGQIDTLCAQGGQVEAVRPCIEAALAAGEAEAGGPLSLNLQVLLGGDPDVVDLSEANLSELGAFGDPADLAALIQLLTQRVIACGIDFFGGAREALRAIRQGDPCAMPPCLHFVWTVKDALCTSCRGSLARPASDGRPLDPFRNLKRFLRSVAAEYLQTASSGYSCRLGADDCGQCRSAAEFWRANDVRLLRGFGNEAVQVVKLLRDLCAQGEETRSQPLRSGHCSDWSL